MEVRQYLLDANKINNFEDTHQYLRELFNFPDYYGNNLSALYDCLSEMPKFNIIIYNHTNLSVYASKIVQIIVKAAIESGGQVTLNYTIRRLNNNDNKIILNLFLTNPEYFNYCPPQPSIETVYEELNELPPCTNSNQKYFLGIFDDKHLIGVLDLILKYPADDTAFIGLFMLNKSYQNKGLGSIFVETVCNYLKVANFKQLNLAYIINNQKAENFWLKNGFIPLKQTKTLNKNTLDVILATKYL